MKILSPAGNFESLKMAVFNGADEVYVGINTMNARNNIDGFTLDNLQQAVDFAHIFGVKVLLAINILFDNNELQNALDTIVDAFNMGVDAFIIQDLGLAYLVHKHFPQIEIHASTQMGLHNAEGVKAIEKFGFKRVVLARETPLEEIKRIKQNCNVEIEYFAQGALCVSFSGNCYLSSYLHNASGNRGKCKQLCRLPYTLEKDGKIIKSGYLLSTKDFNMINHLQQLKDAGVDVIKIEGRARRPSYVAIATKQYYNALHGNSYDVNKLKLAFNRDYTAGYFNGNGNIISDYNNHVGICVGKINNVNYGKKFNEVFFTSNIPLSAKSTFKILNNNHQEVDTITAYDLQKLKNNIYKVTTTHNLNIGDNVHLIVDAQLECDVLSETKKRDVDIQIFAKQDMPVTALITLNDKMFEVTGNVLQKANTQPLTQQQIIENFTKSELFNARVEVCELDDVFITKQNINAFRRQVFDEIFKQITTPYKHNEIKVIVNTNYDVKKFENFKIVENLNDNFDCQNIIYSPEEYKLQDIIDFKQKCKALNKNAYLDTINFALEKDIVLLKNIIEKTNIAIIANNYYALSFNTHIIIGAGLNVYNNITAQVFDKPIITAESNIANKIDFAAMTLRHCPFKNNMGATCAKCPYCDGYSLVMQNGTKLKIKRKKLSTCTFYLHLNNKSKN